MRYVIVGNSAAAVGAVESIRKLDRNGEIMLVGDEPHSVYSRPMIAHFLVAEAGESQLYYRPADFYRKMDVRAVLGQRAAGVDFIEQIVFMADGGKIGYDQLLICTGSSVVRPEIDGINLAGVTSFQKLADARRLKEQVSAGLQEAVVAGGGFIGLRAAQALSGAGVKVTLLVRSRVMRSVLDEEGSALAETLLCEEGITVLKGVSIKEFIERDGGVAGVELEDGRRLPCHCVVVATGVAPDIELVKGTGIKTGRGIVVNRYLQSTYSNVFAAGDVAEAYDIARGREYVNANWPNAREQGRIAGLNMAGERVPYCGSLGMNVISIAGVPFVSLGMAVPGGGDGAGFEIKVRKKISQNIYQKLVFRDNRLKGAIFIGDLGHCGAVKELIREQSQVGIIKDSILTERFQLYQFLRQKRRGALEGNSIQWPETYVLQTPYRKSFNEESWTERERGERKWR